MKVFISWSGAKSRDIANVLRDWLPSVLHAIEPFVSSRDIRAGTRWQTEIASELDDTNFGLICVTKENQTAEWLNFEAGALAKAVDSSRVVPLAVDLSPAEIASPLGQFQGVRLNRDDITDVLTSMNEACVPSITNEHLRKAVEKWWPDLDTELTSIAGRQYDDADVTRNVERPDRALLEEVLDAVRSLGRFPTAPPQRTENPDEELMDRLGTIFRQEGVTGWTAIFSPDQIGISLNSPLPQPAEIEAMAVARVYGRRIQISVTDAEKPKENSTAEEVK